MDIFVNMIKKKILNLPPPRSLLFSLRNSKMSITILPQIDKWKKINVVIF